MGGANEKGVSNNSFMREISNNIDREMNWVGDRK